MTGEVRQSEVEPAGHESRGQVVVRHIIKRCHRTEDVWLWIFGSPGFQVEKDLAGEWETAFLGNSLHVRLAPIPAHLAPLGLSQRDQILPELRVIDRAFGHVSG